MLFNISLISILDYKYDCCCYFCIQSRITCLNDERLTTHGIDYFLYFLPREMKGRRENCNDKALSLSICRAFCSAKQAERLEIMKKD